MELKENHLNDCLTSLVIEDLMKDLVILILVITLLSLFSIIMAGMHNVEQVRSLMYGDSLSLFTLADDINLAAFRLQCSITNINKLLSEQ